MHSDYKIFGLNNRLVWGLILSLQILAGGLAFASIFIKSWVFWIIQVTAFLLVLGVTGLRIILLTTQISIVMVTMIIPASF
jgi:hypothetical protein